MHSLDEFSDNTRDSRGRFDNSSFIKGLSTSINSSNNSVNLSSSPKEKPSKSHGGHHHHSIHEMIKNFGKKVNIWPSRHRHDSINETQLPSHKAATAKEARQADFRSRSRSLDVEQVKKLTDDCEATYKIYNNILKEGIHI